MTSHHPHLGGIAAIVDDLADLWSLTRDTEIFAIQPGARSDQTGRIRLVSAGVSSVNHLLFPFMWVQVALTARSVFRRQRQCPAAVLVSQDGFAIGLGTGIAARLTRTRHVQMDHGTATNILDRLWQRGMRDVTLGNSPLRRLSFTLGGSSRRVITWLAPRVADTVLFYGDELAAHYDRLKIPLSRQRSYSHLIRTDLFRPASVEERGATRSRLAIRADAFLVVVCGRMDQEKGLAWSTPALLEALAEHPNASLLIVGDGALLQWMQRQVTYSNVADRVHIVGAKPRNEVPALLAASDVQVYAGEVSCAFTIALLEGMACGTVPIATPIPRAQERVITPELGWIVPVGDQDGLRAAVAAAIADPAGLEARALACRNYILDQHSFDAAGGQLEAVVSDQGERGRHASV